MVPRFCWKSPPTQGTSPEPRQGHSAIRYQNSMVVFGGEHNTTQQTLSDVHVLNIDTWTWTKPPISGTIPTPRSFHTAMLFNNKMLVWGGYEQAEDSAYQFSDVDLHLLDLQTWEWSQITPSGTPPEPRSHQSAVLFKDKLLIDGGSYDIYSTWDDFYVLDLSQMSWLTVQVKQNYSACLAGLIVKDNTLIKFLGDGAYEGFPGDILSLNLDALDGSDPLQLQWEKVSVQGIKNYEPKIILPNYRDEEQEAYEEGGIPYRTVHGYGEFGNNLVLFAGMVPGNGISHLTIGDVVMLNIPDFQEINSKQLTWLVPKIKGTFPNPRFGHSTLQFNQKMIIFGGLWIDTYSGNNTFDTDVYILESSPI